MRHGNRFKKLNRTSAHRQAMLSNMCVSLLKHEQITTTLPKAKALRSVVEKIITKSRGENRLHVRRQLIAFLQDEVIVTKLMDVLAERYRQRPGGYTRIMRAGFRHGDMAPVAIIELVDRDPTAKGKDSGQKPAQGDEASAA
jgi:large subunit ribosomal protein L17